MISTLISTLNKKLHKKTTTSYVYRDELTKTKPPAPENSTAIKKVKKRVRFAETDPVIISIKEHQEEEEEEGDCDDVAEIEPTGKKDSVVRIKVKMTKEEAVRMLSRCSNGGTLELGDLVCELMRIPPGRVSTAMAVI